MNYPRVDITKLQGGAVDDYFRPRLGKRVDKLGGVLRAISIVDSFNPTAGASYAYAVIPELGLSNDWNIVRAASSSGTLSRRTEATTTEFETVMEAGTRMVGCSLTLCPPKYPALTTSRLAGGFVTPSCFGNSSLYYTVAQGVNKQYPYVDIGGGADIHLEMKLPRPETKACRTRSFTSVTSVTIPVHTLPMLLDMRITSSVAMTSIEAFATTTSMGTWTGFASMGSSPYVYAIDFGRLSSPSNGRHGVAVTHFVLSFGSSASVSVDTYMPDNNCPIPSFGLEANGANISMTLTGTIYVIDYSSKSLMQAEPCDWDDQSYICNCYQTNPSLGAITGSM